MSLLSGFNSHYIWKVTTIRRTIHQLILAPEGLNQISKITDRKKFPSLTRLTFDGTLCRKCRGSHAPVVTRAHCIQSHSWSRPLNLPEPLWRVGAEVIAEGSNYIRTEEQLASATPEVPLGTFSGTILGKSSTKRALVLWVATQPI